MRLDTILPNALTFNTPNGLNTLKGTLINDDSGLVVNPLGIFTMILTFLFATIIQQQGNSSNNMMTLKITSAATDHHCIWLKRQDAHYLALQLLTGMTLMFIMMTHREICCFFQTHLYLSRLGWLVQKDRQSWWKWLAHSYMVQKFSLHLRSWVQSLRLDLLVGRSWWKLRFLPRRLHFGLFGYRVGSTHQ